MGTLTQSGRSGLITSTEDFPGIGKATGFQERDYRHHVKIVTGQRYDFRIDHHRIDTRYIFDPQHLSGTQIVLVDFRIQCLVCAI